MRCKRAFEKSEHSHCRNMLASRNPLPSLIYLKDWPRCDRVDAFIIDGDVRDPQLLKHGCPLTFSVDHSLLQAKLEDF